MSFLKQLLATPRNPYIPNWDKIDPMEVEFSGCKLRLDLPPGSDPDFKDELSNLFDIYSGPYEDDSYLKWYSRDNILGKRLARRSITLKGKPWRSYDYCYIAIGVFAYRVKDLPDSMSCLNPSHFLQVIDKQQFFFYGPNSSCDVSSSFYSVFHNWKVIDSKNTWVFFESVRDRDTAETVIPDSSSLYTPIDDQNFIRISFSISGPYEPIDDCLYTYNNIVNTLISRISLSISPELAEKQQKLSSKCGNDYPKTRPPLQWKSFYLPDWHEDISQELGEKLLIHPIPTYNPDI